jgi:hypothetical protein
VNNSRPEVAALSHAGAKPECNLGTGRAKENEARREGRQGVVAP